MLRVYAPGVAAKMIEMHPRGNVADKVYVGLAVGQHLTIVDADSAVFAIDFCALPVPALRDRINYDVASDPLADRKRMWHVTSRERSKREWH